jgi:hypothetical protein
MASRSHHAAAASAAAGAYSTSDLAPPVSSAAAKVEAENILRAEGALQFEQRSFLGQLLWYESKAKALDDLVRNWFDEASAERVQKVFTGLKGKQLKVAAYAIGAQVYGTADQTRKAIKNLVRQYARTFCKLSRCLFRLMPTSYGGRDRKRGAGGDHDGGRER